MPSPDAIMAARLAAGLTEEDGVMDRASRMLPDSKKHNPDPAYLRGLLRSAGVSQREAARRIGVSERMMRYYLAPESAGYRPAPYAVQWALESLSPDWIAEERGIR